MDSLDPATLRRFLFKVEFRPMEADAAARALAASFGLPAPASLARLDGVTPGNFAVVARKAAVLGERDAGTLVAMLAAEAAAKPGASRGRVGFVQ